MMAAIRSVHNEMPEGCPAPIVMAVPRMLPPLMAAPAKLVSLRGGARDTERDHAGSGKNECNPFHLDLPFLTQLGVDNSTVLYRLVSPNRKFFPPPRRLHAPKGWPISAGR